MATQARQHLINNAPSGRHFAQFHKDTASLVTAVTPFLEAGLERREGVVVIAAPAHAQLFVARLRARGRDVEGAMAEGRFVMLDAEATLDRFMRRSGPSWSDFRQTVGSVFDALRDGGVRTVRAYGEMVDILWREGNSDAAIRLEEHWNQLAAEYSFALYCSYMLDGLSDETYTGPLHEIARTHSDVLANDEDERITGAVDAASSDIFGTPLSRVLSSSGREDYNGEHRLPPGQRTMYWIQRNMPASRATVLARARLHYLTDLQTP